MQKITLNRPKNGTFFDNKESYWQQLEAMRIDGKMPQWAFDFISMHPPVPMDGKLYGQYSLISPMCIIERRADMRRPRFEAHQYRTKAKAIKAARALARHFGVFVLYCA